MVHAGVVGLRIWLAIFATALVHGGVLLLVGLVIVLRSPGGTSGGARRALLACWARAGALLAIPVLDTAYMLATSPPRSTPLWLAFAVPALFGAGTGALVAALVARPSARSPASPPSEAAGR